MAVNTRDVTDRREVHYESFHDLLADAEALSQGDVLTLGNWSISLKRANAFELAVIC